MAERAPNPFQAFNFSVEISVPDISTRLCQAAFAECDGLELNREVKTIREGGNNGQQINLTGPVSYGQLSLKRGLTDSFHLWEWFSAVLEDPALRADATVVILAPGGDKDNEKSERARFALTRCLPIKLKAPPLNAKDGMVAIEEFVIAYETLAYEKPK